MRVLIGLSILISALYGHVALCKDKTNAADSFAKLTIIHPTERVVFTTNVGDLVFSLYPNLAPNHVSHFKKLVTLKLYENVLVSRVIPDFVFQFSEIYHEPDKLSSSQKAALVPVNAEFSNSVPHIRGTLSMAHQNGKPNSGKSSFSIILDNASHLDGKYTVFGELESGWSVVNKVMASSINGVTPSTRIYVQRAFIVEEIADYYKSHPRDLSEYLPQKVIKEVKRKTVDTRRPGKTKQNLLKAIAALVVMTIVIALVAIYFHEKWTKKHFRSMMILVILVSGFTLLILLLEIEKHYTWMGAVFFFVLVGMFKLMSKFEN